MTGLAAVLTLSLAATTAALGLSVAAVPATAGTPSSATSAFSSATSAPVAGGWGTNPTTYLGEYHVTPVDHPATVTGHPAAGLFSLAVRTATALQTPAGPVTGGQLSVFLRKVKTGEPLAPSAILSVAGASGNQVFYLTELSEHGTRRTAVVNGGSFLGVPIGTLTATPGKGRTLDTVITAPGLHAVHVRLQRYSATPP